MTVDHGFTPGKFTPDACQVQLARYPCPYRRDEHDPDLPPEDIDVFGRIRPRDSDYPMACAHCWGVHPVGACDR